MQEVQTFRNAVRAHENAQEAILSMMKSPLAAPPDFQNAVNPAATEAEQPAVQHGIGVDDTSAMDIDPPKDTEPAMDIDAPMEAEPMVGVETTDEQIAEEEEELLMYLGPAASLTAIWFALFFLGTWLGDWLTFLVFEYVQVSLNVQHRYYLFGRGLMLVASLTCDIFPLRTGNETYDERAWVC
jgi:hypothetical protein